MSQAPGSLGGSRPPPAALARRAGAQAAGSTGDRCCLRRAGAGRAPRTSCSPCSRSGLGPAARGHTSLAPKSAEAARLIAALAGAGVRRPRAWRCPPPPFPRRAGRATAPEPRRSRTQPRDTGSPVGPSARSRCPRLGSVPGRPGEAAQRRPVPPGPHVPSLRHLLLCCSHHRVGAARTRLEAGGHPPHGPRSVGRGAGRPPRQGDQPCGLPAAARGTTELQAPQPHPVPPPVQPAWRWVPTASAAQPLSWLQSHSLCGAAGRAGRETSPAPPTPSAAQPL